MAKGQGEEAGKGEKMLNFGEIKTAVKWVPEDTIEFSENHSKKEAGGLEREKLTYPGDPLGCRNP